MPKSVRKKNQSSKTASQKKVGSISAPKLTAAQKRKAEALADAIAVVKKDKEQNRLNYFKPYPWQKKFFKAGLKNKQRMLMAANRVGKTYCQAAEVAYHLTGRYPDWWEGIRFDRPTKIWCLGITGEQLRDVIVAELFGIYLGNGKFDSMGTVSQKDILHVTTAAIPARLPKDVSVKHVSGGTSHVSFKAYSQGQEALMGSSVDYIWIDEEPKDVAIYPQCATRTLTGNDGNGGYMALTMTPEHGMTELVTQFMDEPEEDQFLQTVTWDDAPHLDDLAKKQILSAIPEYQREMRSMGIPILGEGKVFPVSQDLVKCEPFEIPLHFKKLAAVDFGIDHPTTCVWTAYNPDNDIIYVYDIYECKGEVPAIHSAAIMARGKDIPVIYPHDGDNREKGTGETLARMYMKHNVKMIGKFTNPDGSNYVEPGLMEMLERFRTGRLQVFNNLTPWFKEFLSYHRKNGKIHKKNDDLMDATRYAAISVTRYGQNQIEQQSHYGELSRVYSY